MEIYYSICSAEDQEMNVSFVLSHLSAFVPWRTSRRPSSHRKRRFEWCIAITRSPRIWWYYEESNSVGCITMLGGERGNKACSLCLSTRWVTTLFTHVQGLLEQYCWKGKQKESEAIKKGDWSDTPIANIRGEIENNKANRILQTIATLWLAILSLLLLPLPFIFAHSLR